MNTKMITKDEFTQLICVEVSDLKHDGPVEDIWKSFSELQSWIKIRVKYV